MITAVPSMELRLKLITARGPIRSSNQPPTAAPTAATTLPAMPKSSTEPAISVKGISWSSIR